MKFSLKLKELREKNNLSQRELADALSISKGAIGMWESTNRMPNAKRLQQIAAFFNVSMDELIDRDDFTAEEIAAGASATRMEKITPIEDELLYSFRRLGKKHGEETQRAIITMIEKML